MVADAAIVAGAEVGAEGFLPLMGFVGFEEEGEGGDAGGVVEAGRFYKDVVKDGPLPLIFVGAGLLSSNDIHEAAFLEWLHSFAVKLIVEVAHDNDVWVLTCIANRVCMSENVVDNGLSVRFGLGTTEF